MSEGGVVASFVVPVHPHTVLAPDMNPGWRALRNAFDQAAQTINDLEADLLIVYSTTSAPYRTPSTSMQRLPTHGTTPTELVACKADA